MAVVLRSGAVRLVAWDLISVPCDAEDDLSHARPEHMLWALLFLKIYGNETEMATLCGADKGSIDEKTFRKWTYIFVRRMACLLLDVVSFSFAIHCTANGQNIYLNLFPISSRVMISSTDCLVSSKERR